MSSPSGQRGVRLGILGTTLDGSIANAMELPSDQTGVLVQQVEPGSLAETAGLRGGTQSVTINGQEVKIGGDIITALNGQSVTTIQELQAGLAQLISDQKLGLTLLRNGNVIQITIQPGQ